jgi:hypothetical protein
VVIEEEIRINAPLSRVWQVFSKMEDWKSWNDVCEQCCYLQGDEMEMGTCFSFVIKPFHLPIRIAPRIVKCEPGREVTWVGDRLGIHAEHRFRFSEKDGQVILLSVERFSGPMVWLSRLVFVPSRLHRLTRQLLAAIKARSESSFCDAQQAACPR